MSRYKLEAKPREKTGKSGALRREQRIPAVIYGAHIESQAIEIPQNEVEKFVRNQGTGSTLDLVVGKDTHLALFKAMQVHPLSRMVMHLDFQALRADEKVRVTIPVNVVLGEHMGGDNMMVQELLSEIEIVALPGDLESSVTVHVEEGEIGDILTLGELDIAKNDKIEILTDLESPVYNIVEVREFVEPELEEDDVLEGEAVEAEDGEVADAEAGEEAPAEEATEE